MNKSIEYIESFAWLGSRPGLSRMTELMQRMGNPQNRLRFVHLAGTNGKGSTASFLANILQAAGYKTGLHISPYIHSFHERIQVNGISISDAALERTVSAMQPHADAMDDHPTSFELVTAAAFSWFEAEKCDIVVLETGMGGELDATNIIGAPEVAVITPIGMDHMEYLGNTIGKIAKAKAGIIKPGASVVTARQAPDALEVLAETAVRLGNNFIQVDWAKLTEGEFDLEGQRFSFGEMDKLSIRLLGRYQIENAAVAITAANVLNSKGLTISNAAIRDGLQWTSWPGRFEYASGNPAVIIDGGHNAQGGAALADNLVRYFPNCEIVFIIGVLADKDWQAITAPILPCAKAIYTITPDSSRAMSAEDLAICINSQKQIAVPVQDIETALTRAKEAAGKTGIVCYFGSLYTVGKVREILGLHES